IVSADTRISACCGYSTCNRPAIWSGERSFLNQSLTVAIKGALSLLGRPLDSSRRCPACCGLPLMS
ncbi:MAG: hypothetical protein LBF75_01295, partial [Treponema sp.]|nr:hypothetical protein [Treponema sp.]